MAYGLSNGHVTDDATALYGQFQAGAQINFPESGRGLGHVPLTIFGSTVGYPSDSLASC